MSVLIKGMKMPTEGKVMTIYKLKGEFYASLNGTELCPLIELHDHGDLVERDALVKELIELSDDEWNKKTGTSWARAFEEAADVVYNAPVVIPAERSEE